MTFKTDFRPGTFKIIYPDGSVVNYDIKIRHRGGTSSDFAKFSFAIKFCEIATDGTSSNKDVQFFDMRNDKYWILDAMSFDPLDMRNRIMFDLWLDFSTKPYYFVDEPKAVNGSRGEYVEVYVNGKYNGIYNLSERIDRKQLQLKKFKGETVKGVLYKGSNYDTLTRLQKNLVPYDNTSVTWGGWEMQYPDIEDGEPIDWKPLNDAINFLDTASTTTFQEQIDDYFDVPVALDFELLLHIAWCADEGQKNWYLSIYDKTSSNKLVITPWDMDQSWGWAWFATRYAPTLDVLNTDDIRLFQRLHNETDYNTRLKDRYCTLRKTVFAYDSLISRFRTYYNRLDQVGALQREKECWEGNEKFDEFNKPIDFPAEYEYVRGWIKERLIYLDKRYGYQTEWETITEWDTITLHDTITLYDTCYIVLGDTTVKSTDLPTVNVDDDSWQGVLWKNPADYNIDAFIYSVEGQLLYTIPYSERNFLERIPVGVYLLRYKNRVWKLLRQ